MDSGTAGIIAIAAAAGAALGLLACGLLARRLRQLGEAQKIVLGEGERRDLAGHASELDTRLEALANEVEQTTLRLDQRDVELTQRLEGAIAHCGVVRYDAMGEMGGRQSSSVALLDSHRSGVVMSSILHRDQARLYAKPIVDGESELDLSPEEQQALDAAMGHR